MSKPFDYSKWDHIEISDDESDCHPNIEKETWFRLKHRSRVEREAKEEEERKEIERKNHHDQARLKDLKLRLQAIANNETPDVDLEDDDAIKAEIKELEAAILKRQKRLEEMERNKKWNIDNICHVVEERTIVNKQAEVAPNPLEKPSILSSQDDEGSNSEQEEKQPEVSETKVEEIKVETEAVPQEKEVEKTAPEKHESTKKTAKKSTKSAIKDYSEFIETYEQILEEYMAISSLEQTKNYLHTHGDILFQEHAQSYLLLACLEDEMNGKHEKMKLIARQSQLLTHISELAHQMKRHPRDVVLALFQRISQEQYYRVFKESVDSFIERVQKRAIDKRREMVENGEYEVSSDKLGPGGLDPAEVFPTLPRAIQESFERQDVELLQKALSEMDPEEAKYHMQRCIDCGLWVPGK